MRIRASAMVVVEGELLVLVYQYPRGDILAIPGGGVREGETVAEAIVREYREELCMTVEVGELRYVGDMLARDDIPQTLHVVFEARITSGEPEINPGQTSASAFAWVPLEDLPRRGVYPDIGRAIMEDGLDGATKGRYLGNCMMRDWA